MAISSAVASQAATSASKVILLSVEQAAVNLPDVTTLRVSYKPHPLVGGAVDWCLRTCGPQTELTERGILIFRYFSIVTSNLSPWI
ncbi:hypothetical protein [Aerosakkonema funiforme]|uniref:hypothetical protein n=1 Tax=Aerosakkonema funiforme TaxID=1246630 RepID=UPI0035B8F8F1